MQKEKSNLIVTSSPHISSGDTVAGEMRIVILALLPAVFGSFIFFGAQALNIIFISVVTAVVLEAVLQRLTRKPVTVFDGSAVVLGILLAFNLPPCVPWWIPVIGTAAAVLVAKHPFGGLGHNIFNPALVGRAFLLAAYPGYMTSWVPSRVSSAVHAVTYATPLPVYKWKAGAGLPGYWDMFVGNTGGCIGETSAVLLILGGFILLSRKVITWHIPVSYIGTVFLLTFFLGRDPVFHILAGGLILGAVFMATDLVTSPVTPAGMIIFGIGCGVITVGIRLYGKYPEGVSYAILFMNACVPLIDRYTKRRIFGKK